MFILNARTRYGTESEVKLIQYLPFSETFFSNKFILIPLDEYGNTISADQNIKAIILIFL